MAIIHVLTNQMQLGTRSLASLESLASLFEYSACLICPLVSARAVRSLEGKCYFAHIVLQGKRANFLVLLDF